MTSEVDEYLAGVPEPSRGALEALRQTIKDALPEFTEGISYKVPTFKYQNRPVVAYGATQTGCTFYVMSTGVFNAFRGSLSGFKTGQGSIRFQPDHPLPVALVTEIVKARVAENTGRYR